MNRRSALLAIGAAFLPIRPERQQTFQEYLDDHAHLWEGERPIRGGCRTGKSLSPKAAGVTVRIGNARVVYRSVDEVRTTWSLPDSWPGERA